MEFPIIKSFTRHKLWSGRCGERLQPVALHSHCIQSAALINRHRWRRPRSRLTPRSKSAPKLQSTRTTHEAAIKGRLRRRARVSRATRYRRRPSENARPDNDVRTVNRTKYTRRPRTSASGSWSRKIQPLALSHNGKNSVKKFLDPDRDPVHHQNRTVRC